MNRACFSRVLLLAAAIVSGCGTGHEFSGPVPKPDGGSFTREVYPLLLRDCAFVACHGSSDRFFQVLGPGRVRLDPSATKPDDPAVLAEVAHSYERARSMLATADRVEDCLLLNKPLEPGAGGQGHKGADQLGRNLFASKADSGYLLLLRWARSTGLQPTAAEIDAANAAVAPTSESAP